MTDLRIIPADRGRARRQWLRMPWTVMERDPHFIPPLRFMERQNISPRHNPFFQFGEVALFLAVRGKRPIGRISAQINRRSNEYRRERACHFGFFDCLNDPEAATALVRKALDWGAARGMDQLIGPFNLSINQTCGVLVEGFDSPSCAMMPQGPSYYDSLLCSAGLAKAIDMLAYRISLDSPAAFDAKLARFNRVPDIQVRPFDSKRSKRDIALMADIYNDAWAENWGFVPFSTDEIRAISRDLTYLASSEAGAFISLKGEDQAMLLALPDWNALTRDFDGRFLPFNWVRYLWRLKVKPLPSARIILGGVRRRHQASLTGIAMLAALLGHIREIGVERGVKWVELSWILETNRPMISLAKSVAGPPVKRYRMYHMPIKGTE